MQKNGKVLAKIGACIVLGLWAKICFATIYQPTKEHQRDPNQYCAKCHKYTATNGQQGGDWHLGKFEGIHLNKQSPHTGEKITCVSCHGKISEHHREGTKDVMRFQQHIFSPHSPMFTVEEQNQVCFTCHQPNKLREVFWAHDVHAMTLPCASCHRLHPPKDPMPAISQKEQVKLCVDCHRTQQQQPTSIRQGKRNSGEK